jgi:hypothetical protein
MYKVSQFSQQIFGAVSNNVRKVRVLQLEVMVKTPEPAQLTSGEVLPFWRRERGRETTAD